MAFDAGANVLTDRKKFKNFFRTLPHYEFLPRALVQTALEFEWTQMAVITQTENLFTSVRSILGKYSDLTVFCRSPMSLQFCSNSVVGHWIRPST